MKKEKKGKNKNICVISAAAVVLYLLGFVGDNFFTDTFYSIKSEKIKGTLRIVNVSDLHNKLWGKNQNRLIAELKKLSPDIIIMTGDAVSDHKHYENALVFISEASKIAPVYFSAGNHEYSINKENFNTLMKRIKDAGANVLVDESVTVCPDGKNNINIIGLDNYSLGNDTLHNLRENIRNDYFTVVLAHRPHFLKNYFSQNCETVFCGHAHGGQIRLPFIGGLYAPDQGVFPKVTEGCFTENGTSVIVSRGLGNDVPVPRFFNIPELVVADISEK